MTDSGGGAVEAAAAGRLPAWAEVSPERAAHISRVAELMGRWAEALRLDEAERGRWRAVAWLHDALRDAGAETLVRSVGPELRELPAPVLHGPAVATRLREAGVHDDGLLDAIAYHTLGHPSLDRLGRALYLADFLEPGRPWEPAWRAALRARLPEAMDVVLIEVVAARIGHLLRHRRHVRPETIAFWNSLLEPR